MTLELPRPGSIWQYRKSIDQTRVIYSSEHDIIAHNCEVTHLPSKQEFPTSMLSWRGDLSAFHTAFTPGDTTKYPATAH